MWSLSGGKSILPQFSHQKNYIKKWSKKAHEVGTSNSSFSVASLTLHIATLMKQETTDATPFL